MSKPKSRPTVADAERLERDLQLARDTIVAAGREIAELRAQAAGYGDILNVAHARQAKAEADLRANIEHQRVCDAAAEFAFACMREARDNALADLKAFSRQVAELQKYRNDRETADIAAAAKGKGYPGRYGSGGFYDREVYPPLHAVRFPFKPAAAPSAPGAADADTIKGSATHGA